jgi:hypothetical protein
VLNRRDFIRNAVSGLFVAKAAPLVFDLAANTFRQKAPYYVGILPSRITVAEYVRIKMISADSNLFLEGNEDYITSQEYRLGHAGYISPAGKVITIQEAIQKRYIPPLKQVDL